MTFSATRRQLIALVCAFICLGSAGTARADLSWGNDLQGGMNEAQNTGRPLLIYFYATWCPWCKKLDAEGFADPEVQRIANNFILVRLDGDVAANAPAMAQFQIDGFPSLIAYNVPHQTVDAGFTYQVPADLAQTLNNALQKDGDVARQPLAPSADSSGPGTMAAPQYPEFPSIPPALTMSRTSAAVAASVARLRAALAAQRAAEAKLAPKQDGVYLLDDGGTTRIDKSALPVSGTPVPATSKPALGKTAGGKTVPAKATTAAKPAPPATATASGSAWSAE